MGTAFKHPFPCRVNGSKLKDMYNNKLLDHLQFFSAAMKIFFFLPSLFPIVRQRIAREMLVTYSFSNTYVSLQF